MNFDWSILLKTTIILASAGIAATAMHRASASARHAVWTIGLLCALALPIASFLGPKLELPILAEQSAEAEPREMEVAPAGPESNDHPLAAAPLPFESASIEVAPQAAVMTPSVSRFTQRQWIFSLWGVGALFVLIRLLRSSWFAIGLTRTSLRVRTDSWLALLASLRRELRVQSAVDLRIGGEMPPMTWGVFRHVILLPDAALQWTEERLRAVLAHELAHIRRRDGLIQILVQVACSVYWFNPLAWYAAKRMRVEREKACDDQVVALGVEPDDYAVHLVQIARNVTGKVPFAAVSMAHHAQLEDRVSALLDPLVRRYPLSRRTAAFAMAFLGALTVSVAAIRVTALASMPFSPMIVPAAAPAAAAPAIATMPSPVAEPQQQTATTATSGIVEGIVTRTGSIEPLPEVTITLTMGGPRSGNAQRYTGTTNAEGRFVVVDVMPGTYLITASKTGLAAPVRPPGPAPTVNVSAGQRVRDLKFELHPMSAVTGRIVDTNGEPARAISVFLLRQGYIGGRKIYSNVGAAITTDDRGEYRLFNIQPGEYLLSAVPPQQKRDFAATYYPGTASVDAAQKIVVPAGKDLNGISFALANAAFHSARFKIINATPPPPNTPVQITTRLRARNGHTLPLTRDFDYVGDNTYVVPRLSEGTHEIEVEWGPGYGPPVQRIQLTATIADRDVDLGTVTIGPVRTITGQVKSLDPASSLPPISNLVLRAWGSIIINLPVPLSANGTFSIDLPEGRYRFVGPTLPADHYIASIRYGGQEVLDTGLLIDKTPPGPVEIGIAQGPGTLSGVVRNTKDEPVYLNRVVLSPAMSRRQNADAFAVVSTDTNGVFTFAKVPPGEYSLLALDVLPMEAHLDAEFMKQFEKQEVKVTVERGSQKTVNLRNIPN
jgi:beta-lactamase regulating signal transducer with metallopeptidase domain